MIVVNLSRVFFFSFLSERHSLTIPASSLCSPGGGTNGMTGICTGSGRDSKSVYFDDGIFQRHDGEVIDESMTRVRIGEILWADLRISRPLYLNDKKHCLRGLDIVAEVSDYFHLQNLLLEMKVVMEPTFNGGLTFTSGKGREISHHFQTSQSERVQASAKRQAAAWSTKSRHGRRNKLESVKVRDHLQAVFSLFEGKLLKVTKQYIQDARQVQKLSDPPTLPFFSS
jgi:hypothetical protein